jgi:hypothetical protein
MFEHERETQKVANKIKQKEAASMRALCRTVIEEAKTATKIDAADEDMVITLVALIIAQTWRCLSLERTSPVRPTTTPLKQSTCLG